MRSPLYRRLLVAEAFELVAQNGHPEGQYLDLMRHILENGDERVDRTGVGTRSVFGATARFDLSDGTAPIITTKRVYWKTSIKEMLWFLKN